VKPFETSWILLKRNFFQRIGDRLRYGPVKYYHGTTADSAKNIAREGFQPNKNEIGIRGQGTYVSQNPAVAGKFATSFGTRPVEQQGMIGVRSKVPMDSFQVNEGDANFANQGMFSQPIPPQYLVNLKPKQYSQQNVPTDYQEFESPYRGYSAGDWSQPVPNPYLSGDA